MVEMGLYFDWKSCMYIIQFDICAIALFGYLSSKISSIELDPHAFE